MLDKLPIEYIESKEPTLADLPVGELGATLAIFLKLRMDRTLWINPHSTIFKKETETGSDRLVWVSKLPDGTVEANITDVVRNGFRFKVNEILFPGSDLRVSRIIIDG